jgi:hypothetical protein
LVAFDLTASLFFIASTEAAVSIFEAGETFAVFAKIGFDALFVLLAFFADAAHTKPRTIRIARARSAASSITETRRTLFVCCTLVIFADAVVADARTIGILCAGLTATAITETRGAACIVDTGGTHAEKAFADLGLFTILICFARGAGSIEGDAEIAIFIAAFALCAAHLCAFRGAGIAG